MEINILSIEYTISVYYVIFLSLTKRFIIIHVFFYEKTSSPLWITLSFWNKVTKHILNYSTKSSILTEISCKNSTEWSYINKYYFKELYVPFNVPPLLNPNNNSFRSPLFSFHQRFKLHLLFARFDADFLSFKFCPNKALSYHAYVFC